MRHLARDAKILASKGRRAGWLLAALIAIVLVAAWIDGGEQPLRTIEEPVELPERAR